MSRALDRLLYVDDSGHPASGRVVFAWIDLSPGDWSHVLQEWLDTRKRLWREYGIPVTQELHATEFVNGRGRISTRPPERLVRNGHVLWKDLGREVAEECLATIRSTRGLRVGAVHRAGASGSFADTKHRTYTALIADLEEELARTGSLAMVLMDGDGSDAIYRTTHRQLRLARRHVIEDAIHLDSRHSQLVQMADLVAWSANAHIDRHRGNEFAWHWYSTYLSERDPHRLPREI